MWMVQNHALTITSSQKSLSQMCPHLPQNISPRPTSICSTLYEKRAFEPWAWTPYFPQIDNFTIRYCVSNLQADSSRKDKIYIFSCHQLPPTDATPRTRAGLHDNVPDRPSAKVAPVRCHLAPMAFIINTVTIQKGVLHGRSCHPNWDVSAPGMSCTRLAGFLPPWQ